MGNSKMSLNEFKKINNSETREKKSSYQGNPRKNWNNRNYNSSQSQDSKSEIEKIMDSIKKEGYRNESKNILRKKLIFEESQKIAEELSKEKLSNSQLRAFFNEINKLKLKYIKNDRNDEKENQEELGNLAIELLILKSKLEYRRGKSGNNKLPKNFYIFMKENIDYIVNNDKKIYFKDFKTFFETVIGYTYGLGGVNNR